MSAKTKKAPQSADAPVRKKAKRPAKPPVRSADDVNSFTGRKRVRRSFGRIREVAQMPNLIEVQRDSYEQFLQTDVDPDSRRMQGLHKVLTEVLEVVPGIRTVC